MKPAGYFLKDYVSNLHSPTGIEIGCETGKTTKFLLDCYKNLKLYTIDPFVYNFNWSGVECNIMEGLLLKTKELLEPYGERVQLIRKTSDEAHSEFENESIDFVFIDGNHLFYQVKRDLDNYYSKVKPNGLFCGHDYDMEDVKKAVDSFSLYVDKKVISDQPNVWYWHK